MLWSCVESKIRDDARNDRATIGALDPSSRHRLGGGSSLLRQKPIFAADRGHIHHRLLDRGLTPRKVALLLYGCCAVGAVCSLAIADGNLSGPILISSA